MKLMFIVQLWLIFGKTKMTLYTESKSAIYTIVELMVYYMGYKRKDLCKYAIDKLNGYCIANDIIDYTTDEAEKEFRYVD